MTECAVISVTQLATNIFQLILKPEEKPHFYAGQYLNIVLENGKKCAFSIANTPTNNDGVIELHIATFTEDPHTLQIIEIANKALHDNSLTLRVEFPLGDAYFRPVKLDSRPIILIAGGTGFSYVQSILQYCLDVEFEYPIYIYWGGQEPERLYANEKLIALTKSHSHITYKPVVMDAKQNWNGAVGNVLDIVMDDFATLEDKDIYIAGRFDMAKVAREKFCRLKNANVNHIYSDAFAFI